jgi:hypothetical protein
VAHDPRDRSAAALVLDESTCRPTGNISPVAAPRRQPDRALSEVGATKAIAHRGNFGSACVRYEVTLDRVTSGTILVLNNTNRDEAKQRLAILTFVEE